LAAADPGEEVKERTHAWRSGCRRSYLLERSARYSANLLQRLVTMYRVCRSLGAGPRKERIRKAAGAARTRWLVQHIGRTKNSLVLATASLNTSLKVSLDGWESLSHGYSMADLVDGFAPVDNNLLHGGSLHAIPPPPALQLGARPKGDSRRWAVRVVRCSHCGLQWERRRTQPDGACRRCLDGVTNRGE
jgi:hypothetical protein